MEKNLEITERIRELYYQVTDLESAMKMYMRPNFFGSNRATPEEVLVFVSSLASARANLWKETTATYPEIKGKSASINATGITYTEGEAIR